MPAIPKPIVFSRIPSRLAPLERMVLGGIAAIAAGAMLWIWRWEVVKMPEVGFFDRFGGMLWLHAGAIAFAAVASLIIHYQMKHALLVLDSAGIRMELDVKPASFLVRRRIAWDQLAQVSHMPGFGVVQLRPKGSLAMPWPIRVKEWRLRGAPAGPDLAGGTSADLLGTLEGLGVFKEYPKSPAAVAAEFDLAGHPATRRALIVLGILGVYSVADRLLQDEAWAFFNLAYCLPHLIAGSIAALAMGVWLGNAGPRKVPVQVAFGLALVTGLASGAASYIGGVRINQAVGGELVEAAYHRSADCLALNPVDQSLPVIEYTDMAKPYWCGMPASRTVPVLVRKGLFGLYQVNLTEHTRAIREFRASR